MLMLSEPGEEYFYRESPSAGVQNLYEQKTDFYILTAGVTNLIPYIYVRYYIIEDI